VLDSFNKDAEKGLYEKIDELFKAHEDVKD